MLAKSLADPKTDTMMLMCFGKYLPSGLGRERSAKALQSGWGARPERSCLLAVLVFYSGGEYPPSMFRNGLTCGINVCFLQTNDMKV
jgi:hypothetical protein